LVYVSFLVLGEALVELVQVAVELVEGAVDVGEVDVRIRGTRRRRFRG
jgi:hypothetical protein